MTLKTNLTVKETDKGMIKIKMVRGNGYKLINVSLTKEEISNLWKELSKYLRIDLNNNQNMLYDNLFNYLKGN
jgi:hypothetical protein